jgi:hypothetical protein
MENNSKCLPYLHLAVLASIAMLVACASPIGSPKNDNVGIGIHSLNYSAREVAYIAVEKPGEPNGGGGGDALNPYSGGGTICCFSIPEKWHPDLKVVIKYNFYPESEYRKQVVNVPPYGGGKPGDIWLIVHADESVEAVVSDFSPTREEWPGKVKGYPVPSREYRLKIWEREVESARHNVTLFAKFIKEFSPRSIAENWNHDKDRDKGRSDKKLQRFTGPDDPKYAEYLKKSYEEGLRFFSIRLESLLRNKP